MKKIILAIAISIGMIACVPAQIKVKNLPTTTVGTGADYLIKDRSDGGAGATQKITVSNFLTTYSISSTNVLSGTYTPTITNTNNMTGTILSNFNWTRINDNVSVYGNILTGIPAIGNFDYLISLPIPSVFTVSSDAVGFGLTAPKTGLAGIQQFGTFGSYNNNITMFGYASYTITSTSNSVSFSYKIK